MDWSARLDIGLKGLLLRKSRSLLSTLGVVFGVAAVVSMMAIGEGARRESVEQVKLLGTNNIRIKQLQLNGERQADTNRRYSLGLTQQDATVIRHGIPGLLGIAPLKFLTAEVRFEGRQGLAQIVGTSAEYSGVTNFRVGEGRFITEFDETDAKTICVLGSEIKQELFGYRDALNAAIRIGDSWFTVVGVMEPKAIREGRAAAIKLRNINRDVYIPLTAALSRLSATDGGPGIDELSIRVADADRLSAVARSISRFLTAKHRGVEDYEVIVPEELLAQARRTQQLFNIVMGSIAGIALLVGGIGIMNIMLANVSERTREIGIRRAIGATKQDIMGQFLIETVLICLAGGIIGIVLGMGMALVITFYANWETGFSVASVVIAVGTSASVGIAFGLYPAQRAAELNPVQALRSE